jgi:hypothetical protein
MAKFKIYKLITPAVPAVPGVYAGKGNGSNIYINTGIAANIISGLEIVFQNPQNTGYHGAKNSADRFLFYTTTSTCVVAFGASPASVTYPVNQTDKYRMTITVVSGSYTTALYNLTTSANIAASAGSATGSTGTITTRTFKIYAADNNGTLAMYSNIILHSFKINPETWSFPEGSGNKTTGSAETELTINGTLTNFWQTITEPVPEVPAVELNYTAAKSYVPDITLNVIETNLEVSPFTRRRDCVLLAQYDRYAYDIRYISAADYENVFKTIINQEVTLYPDENDPAIYYTAWVATARPYYFNSTMRKDALILEFLIASTVVPV